MWWAEAKQGTTSFKFVQGNRSRGIEVKDVTLQFDLAASINKKKKSTTSGFV